MTLHDIQAAIKQHIPDATVHVMDPNQDGQHLEAIVISPSFNNMMLVKQHQMVMKPLKEAFQQSVHALALKTFTPEKWEEQKTQYGF